ncbi:MAG: hypothetical protein RLZZ15_2857 [Verrucomicrobiota bacterium]
MTFTRAHRHFLDALREDAALPPPALRTGTADDFREWKAEMRAFDQAQLDLGLVTAAQLQERNAAVRVRRFPMRIVKGARYA